MKWIRSDGCVGWQFERKEENTEFRELFGLEPVSLLIKRNRLRWLGHIEHNDDTDWVKWYMVMVIKGTRERRQPKKTCVKPMSHYCDSTMIRLRYDDTATHSTTTEVIEIKMCVRFDYDTTTIRLRRKIDVHFLLTSNGSRRGRYVVVGL